MAPKNPVGKLAETALSTLKDPKAAAGKAVGQAKGTVGLGKLVAETAGSMAGQVVARATGRKRGAEKPSGRSTTVTAPVTTEPKSRADLRAVPDVNEPAATKPAGTVKKAAEPAKKQGDALAEAKPAAKKAAPAKAAAKKAAPAKKQGDALAEMTPTKEAAPAKKAAKAPAKSSTGTAAKAPAKKASKKVSATPADVAEVVESAVAEDPTKTGAKPAKKAPAKKSAATKAPATKAPAKKAPAKKSSPGGKLPAKKARPKTAAELAANEGDEVRTPAGTPAVSEGTNPSTKETGLTQPGTESIVDSSTAKKVASETDTLRKAAESNPE